jgi:hypothetical protein
LNIHEKASSFTRGGLFPTLFCVGDRMFLLKIKLTGMVPPEFHNFLADAHTIAWCSALAWHLYSEN